MTYIVIFNTTSREPQILTDAHGFTEQFTTYEDAEITAETWQDEGQFKRYQIFALCTAERYHVI